MLNVCNDMTDKKFNSENFNIYHKISCVFYQLAEYFYKKYNLTTVPDIYNFGEDYFDKIYRFNKLFSRYLNEYPCGWVYINEDGIEYTEDQLYEMLKKYYGQ